MDGPLSVENEQLGTLKPLEAVRFFHALLLAELQRLHISPEIRISERITVKDGGIDASASNPGPEQSDLIKLGFSAFQIKTGTTFGLRGPVLKRELFGPEKVVAKENLGDGVLHCLEQDGNLTLVCFGLDPVESEVIAAVALIKGWLDDCGFPDANVRIWGQSTIKGFLDYFPSLRLDVNRWSASMGFEILESWKSRGDMAPETLSLGDAQKKIIEEIREQILTNTEAMHLRITGESGVGKTRLVLEALDDDRIRPLVLYTETPAQLQSSGFLTQVCMPDNQFEIVLVLDECSMDTATEIWNRLQTRGRRIRLITIYNEEATERTGPTMLISLPQLEDNQIAEILTTYEIPGEYIARWARFCEGSPRFAIMIGQNLKNNEKDVLAEPDNLQVVNRYIAGTDDLGNPLVRDRKLIICFLSLFGRVGYKAPVAEEADAVFKLIAKYDTSITRMRFDESIRNLHDRRILQGEKTYYITPKPLQVKLWMEWWDKYSSTFSINDFGVLPPALVSGFNQMFRYAHDSEVAMKTVERLLSVEGPFEDGKLLHDENGGDFFLALTEAAPVRALERLEATVATWSDEELLAFTTGRRNVLSAIERIAVWSGLCVRSLRILLRLATSENDTIFSNNSTGIFTGFFSIFSPTEESPMKRLALVEEMLASKNPVQENIAVRALTVAVDDHYTRMIGAEHQGLRREPQLWDPRDHPEEARTYMLKAWDMLVDSLATVSKENRASITMTLMHQLQVWGRTPGSSHRALKTAKQLLSQGDIDKNALIEAVVHILHYGDDELPDDIQKIWADFYAVLVPDDFSSQLNRFVAMNLTEDSFRNRGEYAEDDKTKRIQKLAIQAFQNQGLLLRELSWLLTDRAGNGSVFGYYLGKEDGEEVLLPHILGTRRNTLAEYGPSQYFLGGYLRAVYERDHAVWEKLFMELSNDEVFLPLLPELAWRAGHTDTVIEYLLSLIEAGKVDPIQLAHFKYGVSVREFSESTLHRFVRLLLFQKRKITSSIALDVFSRYYADEDAGHELSTELALEVLTDPMFFVESEGRGDTMDQFTWARVANKFIEKAGANKETVLKIGNLMLDSIGNKGSILDYSDRYVKEVLAKISEMYPDEMWVKALSNLQERGYFIFKRWLSSNEFFGSDDHVNVSLLQRIKLDTLWKWVDEDVEKRAWFIASIVPKVFSNEPGETCLAREILIRYGDRDDVRRNLHANFFSEGWSGPASIFNAKQLGRILPLREKETEPNVIRWLDEYIDQRKRAVENSKTAEERDDFWN